MTLSSLAETVRAATVSMFSRSEAERVQPANVAADTLQITNEDAGTQPAAELVDALAAARIETARAAAALDERNPRLAAFADAIEGGVSILTASKIAGRIEARVSRLTANPPPAPNIDAGYAEGGSTEQADIAWNRIVDGMNALHGVVRPTR